MEEDEEARRFRHWKRLNWPFWFAVFWTFAPLLCSVVLLVLWWRGIFGTTHQVGTIIQAFTASPLAFTFRQRFVGLWHNITDWVHGAGAGKEETALYQIFLFFRGSDPSVKQRFLVSVLDVLGLVLILAYFVGGAVMQNIDVTRRGL